MCFSTTSLVLLDRFYNITWSHRTQELKKHKKKHNNNPIYWQAATVLKVECLLVFFCQSEVSVLALVTMVTLRVALTHDADGPVAVLRAVRQRLHWHLQWRDSSIGRVFGAPFRRYMKFLIWPPSWKDWYTYCFWKAIYDNPPKHVETSWEIVTSNQFTMNQRLT